MTRVDLKHINRVRKKLADQSFREYFYHRRTNIRLQGKPGTPEFIASYVAAEKQVVLAPKVTAAGKLTDIIAAYETSADFTQLKASTRKEKLRKLKRIKALFGTMPNAVFSNPEEARKARGEFLAWRDQVAGKGTLREAENCLADLASVFAWAKDRGAITENPLNSWKRKYKSDRSDKIWEPRHVERFVAVASSEMVLALYLALYTGQRQGDLLSLTWTNYQGGRLRLKQSKGGRNVEFGCIDRLRNVLDGVRDGGGRTSTHILVSPQGRPWKKRRFSFVFKETCKAAGIEGLTFHDLRGTAVTMLADADCTVPQIVSITGHSLRSAEEILKRYMARTPAQAAEAMRKLEEHLKTEFANHSLQIANRSTRDR